MLKCTFFKAVVRLGGSKFKEKCNRVLRQLSSQVSRQKSIANDEKIENHDILEAVIHDEGKKSDDPYRCSCQGNLINK